MQDALNLREGDALKAKLLAAEKERDKAQKEAAKLKSELATAFTVRQGLRDKLQAAEVKAEEKQKRLNAMVQQLATSSASPKPKVMPEPAKK